MKSIDGTITEYDPIPIEPPKQPEPRWSKEVYRALTEAYHAGRDKERAATEALARELEIRFTSWTWCLQPSEDPYDPGYWALTLHSGGYTAPTIEAPTQHECITQALELLKGGDDESKRRL